MANSQFPIPNQCQTPNARGCVLEGDCGHWALELGHSLVIGHWSLVIYS